MGYKHFSAEQMVMDPHSSSVATADLDEFLEDYADDDNLWWRIECGHHMNLFDAAVERIQQTEERCLVLKESYDKMLKKYYEADAALHRMKMAMQAVLRGEVISDVEGPDTDG